MDRCTIQFEFIFLAFHFFLLKEAYLIFMGDCPLAEQSECQPCNPYLSALSKGGGRETENGSEGEREVKRGAENDLKQKNGVHRSV